MKTSKKHFEIFKKSFLEYQNKLGLGEWKIYFYLETLMGRWATIGCDHEGMFASVRLTEETEDNTYDKDFNPRISGKHEAIHLLLAELANLANRRYVSEREIYEAEERIVRRLEKVL